MTTTPEPAVCGARHPDAVGGDVACELLAGHVTAHRAHTTPDQYEAWTDDAAGAPVTNPCRATYETPTARTIRRATEEAESAKACERETFADLAAERAAHEEHRRALADALGLIDPRSWPEMIDQVSVIRAAATEHADLLEEARDALESAGQTGAHGDDWPAIAPAIRKLAADRDAAVDGERRAMQQRQEMAEERYALQQRADLADRVKRTAARDAEAALKRAAMAEAAVRDYENRLTWETTCGEHARLLDSCRAADERAEQAETGRDRWKAAAFEQQQRAATAEATLTRVRAQCADWAEPTTSATRNGRLRDAVAATCADIILRALGDDQPTPDAAEGDTCGCCGHHITWHRDAGTRPCHKIGCHCGAFTTQGDHRCCVCGSPEVGYHNYREQPFCWPCANGDKPVPGEATTPEPDPPAEPELIPVLDYAVRRAAAAIQRALRARP